MQRISTSNLFMHVCIYAWPPWNTWHMSPNIWTIKDNTKQYNANANHYHSRL